MFVDKYPIMLNIQDRIAVVVGGGRIAYRKIISLLQSGACVTVISPEVSSRIEQLYIDGSINWKQKSFAAEDIHKAFVVIAATDDKQINREVALIAGPMQLVNIVDDPELSNFHVPATLRRGRLTIAVATVGASPILAKKIRDDLAETYDETYADYVDFLAKARTEIKKMQLLFEEQRVLLKEITKDTYVKSTEKQKQFLLLIHIHLATEAV